MVHDIYILTDSDPIEIKTNEEATVNLELSKAPPCYDTLLMGKVLDNECPISNATVKVFDKYFNPLFHTATDDNGVFEFKNLLPPGEYKIIASASYYTTSATKPVTIIDKEVIKVVFRMKRTPTLTNGVIYGKILDESTGNPIANAVIYIKPLAGLSKVIYKTTSNSNGQYLVYNIFPNSYIIEAEKYGYISSNPVEVTVEKYDYKSLNFYLVNKCISNNSTLSGIITSNNVPVPKAQVFLYAVANKGNESIVQSQVTNESGVYLFSNLKNGQYVVKVKLQTGEWFEKCIDLYE